MIDKIQSNQRFFFFIFLIGLVSYGRTQSFQFKQVMPRSQWMNYSPDEPERAVILDGNGGAILVAEAWGPLIAQRIDRNGYPHWGNPKQMNKVFVYSNPNDTGFSPILLSDGAGGALVAYAYAEFLLQEQGWYYNYDVYVQHLSAAGERLWGDKGAAVGTSELYNEYPYAISAIDSNNFLILHSGKTESAYPSVYLQRLNLNGMTSWPQNTKVIKANDKAGVTRFFPLDDKIVLLIGYINFAQLINADGEFLWSAHFTETGIDLRRKWIFKTDESEVLLIGNSMDYKQINAQKLELTQGLVLWGEHGRSWPSPDSSSIFPIITPNGNGGAFIFWQHFLQEIDTNGNYRYDDPIAVLYTSCFRHPPQPVSGDFSSDLGAFILYTSQRLDDPQEQVILQRITPEGELPWGKTGITICDTTIFLNSLHSLIKIDPESNEAFIFLEFNSGIFVTKVDLASIGPFDTAKHTEKPFPSTFDLKCYPNPFLNSTTISISNLKAFQPIKSIIIYNILGREVKTLTNKINPAFASKIIWSGCDAKGYPVSPGIYFVQVILENQTQTQKILKIH